MVNKQFWSQRNSCYILEIVTKLHVKALTSIVPMYQFVEVQLTDVSLWAKTLYEDKQNSQ